MSARNKYIFALCFVIILLLVFVFGPGKLSFKKKYNLVDIIPISKEESEATLCFYLSQPSKNELQSSLARLNKSSNKISVPKNGIYLSISASFNNLVKLETLTGKKFSILNQYVYWGEADSAFNTLLASKLWLDNKALLVTWYPSKSIRRSPVNQPSYRLRDILKGKFDTYINKWAKDVKDWKRPVIVRFAPEMNGNWLPWGSLYTTPREYIKTYRYVVDIFKANNVQNVSWMWSPNVVNENEDLLDYYPGDEYVDWVGLSGFNWGGLESFNEWRSFEDIYSNSLSQLTDLNKPIALAEFGTVESKTDRNAKSDWILHSFNIMKTDYPQIKLVNWSNDMSFGIYDWRINTSANSLRAFRKAVSDNYYLGVVKK